MNKSGLIENIANKASLNLNKVEEVVDLFFNYMAKALASGGRVEIRGFGALTVKEYDSYVGRNPKTGEKITVNQKRLPVWRTGLELKKRVDGDRTHEDDTAVAG